MNLDEILALAADTGAVAYSPPPLRAVRGYSFTYEELEDFYHAAIQHYKDNVLKEVGEPVGLVTFVDGECYAELSDTAKLVEFDELFTSDQVTAARKGLEEEIERLKDQLEAAQEELSQADCLNGKIIAENGTLKEQLAKAEQRVAGLEVENERLRLKTINLKTQIEDDDKSSLATISDLKGQLASSQLSEKRLRDACAIAEKTIDIVWVSHHANLCDHALELCQKALAIQTDTSALDAYVAEKVKESTVKIADQLQQERLQSITDFGQYQEAYEQLATITRQRDLAVEALEVAYRIATESPDNQPFDWAIYCEMLYQALSAIKGSEK